MPTSGSNGAKFGAGANKETLLDPRVQKVGSFNVGSILELSCLYGVVVNVVEFSIGGLDGIRWNPNHSVQTVSYFVHLVFKCQVVTTLARNHLVSYCIKPDNSFCNLFQ